MPEPLDFNDPANSDIIDYLKAQGTGGTPTATAAPSGGQTSTSGIAAQALPYVLSLLGPAAKGIGAAGAKTLGMMIGPAAKSWRMPTQFAAKEMEMKGFSPEHVYDATRLFRGQGDDWRKEISDLPMKAKPLPPTKGSIMGSVGSFIEHPELFENYPELKNYKLAVDPGYAKGEAEFRPDLNKITLSGKVLESGLTPQQKNLLLHELMHGVQGIEGWPQGSSIPLVSETVGPKLAETYERTHDPEVMRTLLAYGKVKPSADRQMYYRDPGETEARNVANRYRMGTIGIPNEWPMTTHHSEVQKALEPHGIGLGMTRKTSQGPASYNLYDKASGRMVSPSQLPPEVRALYDRMPRDYGQKDRPLTMIGNPRYPWKTEDIPRWLQFEYGKWGWRRPESE